MLHFLTSRGALTEQPASLVRYQRLMGFVIKQVYQRCLSMEIEAFSLVLKRPPVGFVLVLLCMVFAQETPVQANPASDIVARAYHGDLAGVERIEAYYDVLRQINRGQLSAEQVQEFITNLKGVLQHRPTKKAAVLQALNNLVGGILLSRVAELAPFLKDMSTWKEVLEGDLRHFALANGSVVKVAFSKVPRKSIAVRAQVDGPAVDLLDDVGLSAFFKLAIRGAQADATTQQIVAGGSVFDLVPLYVDRSGVGCGLGDVYGVQIAGDVIATQPTLRLCGLEAGEPLHLMKREKIPAYTGEEIFVSHPGCGQWATVIESVSDDVLAQLENDNIQQALNRIKMMSNSLEKLRWMYALRNNFNARIHEKNNVMLFKQLSAVFGERNKFSKQALLEGRQLLLAYKQKQVLQSYDKYFTEWLSDITRSLEAFSVRFRDTITIKNVAQASRIVCAAPYVSSSAGGYTQEIRLGLGDAAGVNKKHALISLVSPVGKVGPVKFGDEVELAVCYAQESELRCAVEQSGETAGARVVGIRMEVCDAETDCVFTVEHPLGSLEHDASPLVANDAFMLRSRKTSQILAVPRELLGLWQPIEAKSDLQIKKEQALCTFAIDVEAEDVVQQVVEQSFYEQLAKVRKNPTFTGKIAELLGLLDLLSPKVSSHERNDLCDLLSGLLADKKYMNDQELVRLEELLQKVKVVAQSNNISGWSSKAGLGLKDVAFHKKMKNALMQPGMDRFKSLLELAPLVKGVSLQQSQVFLDELSQLRKYKKDQSRAAKLLLLHASDEFGQDFKATGTGNLLVP